ncbi:MAG: sigma-70 family RNA polymerase sigma factor [Calditrichaeota bacterium]|nr:MAG: sigma-70 family RNA polymerase sigma factor [Calditrichota bacterium]
MTNVSLSDLIDALSQPSSAQWQKAWQEFLSRYHRFIYHCINQRCQRWQADRLGYQLNDIVEDIYGQVMVILCQDNARVIRNFAHKSDENRFLAWLAAVCNHAATRYLKQQFFQRALDSDPRSHTQVRAMMAEDNHDEWLMFQWINHCLREKQKTRRNNFERDLFIFFLYTFADFSREQIASLPCLEGIGHRVVDVAVNRIRSVLRQHRFSTDI